MEFACSHVICDWSPQHATSASSFLPQYDNSMCQQFSSSVSLIEHIYDNPICDEQQMKRSYTIHHTTSLKAGHPPVPPPPLPSAPVPRPRRMNKPRPTSIPPPPPVPALQRSLGPPPPVPPRVHVVPRPENRLSANVNVISISVGKLVDVSHAARPENYTSPVNCRKCSATLSCLSLTHNNLWLCEFCRSTNAINCNKRRSCMSRLSGLHCDEVYLQIQRDQDYQDLQDSVVVFCVDISGSMSVTSQVPSHSGSTRYISRLKSIQDALQGALMSLMQQSPRRRVALVTFSNEVVVYGDGTVSPMTLSDWSLVDYDHIWQQGVAFNAPQCISETYYQLIQKVENLHEYGATCLGPAALVSVALASRYPGSKVILCTDGKANIGIGELSKPRVGSNFYKKLALHALNYGVIVSVMTFEGTDCRLAEVGTLADTTGGRVNTVNAGTVASEIQSASEDHVLATGVTLTLLAAEGVYFPFEEEEKHRVVKEIGSVTEELEITFQFAVKPHAMDEFLWRKTVPFQIQLSFKTQGQHRVTHIVTEQRPVSTSSGILARDLNLSLLGVHWAQLCGRLTMEGRVEDAQRQLREQQRLLRQVSEQRPIKQEETFYSNWMDTMSNICSDYDKEYESLSDEAAKHVYQLKRASRISKKSNRTIR